ncbi:MAG: heterodisulfide reductase subunit [Thermodesulfobacteriota bacterium]|nr:heterodisulfide reductase subunit [Thermodesulfobacteriota bacterium]
MGNRISSSLSNRVLVVGGGMGGIKTALDLAEAGRDVVLVDKAYSIGGFMTQLDRTFPTNNCDLCTISPFLSESGRNLHIELLTMTQVTEVKGEAGNFTVSLHTRPSFIDVSRCTACGACLKAFPECVRFTPGLDHRAPTCMRYPQATPNAYSIDIKKCSDIEALVKVCPAGAIIPDDVDRNRSLAVGAIVLSTGAELFNPDVLTDFGSGMYSNVITGYDYERILSASGPTGGILVRPSDGKAPKTIAWIQCVGSRGARPPYVSYCSSVCCMYAIKEAVVTKERFGDGIEATLFYMDMRTSGKDYELYYQRAKDEYGIHFVRSRPHTVEEIPETGDLSITYATTQSSSLEREVFDMVVLSTGFRVSPDVVALAGELGIELNRHNYAKTSSFDPVATSRPGIYVCGLFEAPKDIPETMVQASAAAHRASTNLTVSPKKEKDSEAFPPEKDVRGLDPRIGIFVCDCGNNIGGVIDVDEVVKYARGLPGVVSSERIGYGCGRDALSRIVSEIKAHDLNRVVIGGCSPRSHETLFQDTVRRAGLNKYLLEIANIRDQDTWVHADRPGDALDKAKDLIRMAACSVALTHPLKGHTVPVNKSVLVVGGGVTGMNAALGLADQGLKVFLVEKSNALGGVSTQLRRTLEGEDVRAYMETLIQETLHHDNIQVMTNAMIVDHSGMSGLFKTGLQVGPRWQYRQIEHGVAILATGAVPNRPKQYLLDEHEAVMTQLDLEGVIEDAPERVRGWRRVVMIQCVGSRTKENPNCSRICCQAAVKNALRILELNPEALITVLYRDMRTYGFQEDAFREARSRGVIFERYDVDDTPDVRGQGDEVTVLFKELILQRELELTADCLVLSTGLIADDEVTEELSMIFRLPRTTDGYFLEDHVKLRPVDLPVPGFFVAGTAHSPKTIRESVAQAHAVVARAMTVLAKDTMDLGAAVARVDADRCAACLICVRACPFGVPFINAEGYSEIDPAKCHGCGVCAAECPAKAIQLMEYEDDQIMAKLYGLLERVK